MGGGAYEAPVKPLPLLVCMVCQYVYERVALVDWGFQVISSSHSVLTTLAARRAPLENKRAVASSAAVRLPRTETHLVRGVEERHGPARTAGSNA